jgi:hypothetical protein
MNFTKVAITILMAIVLLMTGCSKDKTDAATQTEAGEVDLTITQTVVDSFIKVFPEVQTVVDKYRGELEQTSTDSPVDEVKTAEVMDKIEKEMAQKGLNQDWFFGIYQKIITAGMFLNAVQQAENLKPANIQMNIDQLNAMIQSGQVPPEQKAEAQNQIAQLSATKIQVQDALNQLEEFKAKLADPATPENEKMQMQAAVQQLESIFNPASQKPEGFTEQELVLLETNMPKIIATLEQYNP